MKERNQAIKGRAFTVAGIPGKASSVGLFVPDAVSDEDPRFDTWKTTSDYMLARGMAERRKAG